MAVGTTLEMGAHLGRGVSGGQFERVKCGAGPFFRDPMHFGRRPTAVFYLPPGSAIVATRSVIDQIAGAKNLLSTLKEHIS